jgi:ethanolamine utilization protein EutN
MKLGRVIGTMVATVKPDAMRGLKLLVVRPLTADLEPEGDPFVATDASAQASSGDLVTYEASREAALLHDPWFVPIDHAVVGIIDQHAYFPVLADEASPGTLRGDGGHR